MTIVVEALEALSVPLRPSWRFSFLRKDALTRLRVPSSFPFHKFHHRASDTPYLGSMVTEVGGPALAKSHGLSHC
jgi:hypothetical protein